MATKMSPALWGVGLLAVGAAIYALTRKGDESIGEPDAGFEPEHEPVPAPSPGTPPRGGMEYGEPCESGYTNMWAARTEDGACEVFWSEPEDRRRIDKVVDRIWKAEGSPSCDWISRESSGVRVTNPLILRIASKAIAEMFPMMPADWYPPRKDDKGNIVTPYRGSMVWNFAVASVTRVVCKYTPVF